MYYHISTTYHGKEVVFEPRVPKGIDPWLEDSKTPRICFSSTLEGCLTGVSGHPDWKVSYRDEVGFPYRLNRGKKLRKYLCTEYMEGAQ